MPEITERRRNWAAWGGLLLALAAVLSNFAFFMAVPGQKMIPFLGWALAVVALVFALTGVTRASSSRRFMAARFPARFWV
ncbi:MAG TPA: hypothetical protein VGN44_18785 [Candidatus Angelobacter sp.]